MTTRADGSASGTFTIDDTTRATFPVTVSGSYDPNTGSFDVSGTFSDNSVQRTVRIAGTLPTSGANGSIEVFIDGQSVGTAPLTLVSGGGGGGGGGTGSGTNVTISNATGNVNTSSFSPQQGSIVAVQPGQSGVQGTLAGAVNAVGSSGARTLSVNVVVQETFDPGDTFTVGTSSTRIVGLTYSEASLTGQMRVWAATGGQIAVDGVSGDRARIRLVNVRFAPAPLNNGGATGTFTMKATLNGY